MWRIKEILVVELWEFVIKFVFEISFFFVLFVKMKIICWFEDMFFFVKNIILFICWVIVFIIWD